ncbi:WD repeat-containing protein 90 [Plakobranchus ocellatus]|uniref:WD repeat-containing protein 90 n=1 Tax=Plakobranchus ocellatus TaxID=259542 RepID=A0AAV4BSD9_9GAST|nr:WD repeat-containing protein 90 [Plakobranchus ocellatus]
MDNLWQSPFVNVFKYFNVPSWKKATKEGDVVSHMDKSVRSTVYKISGCVPAGNFILLPKTNSQSLGLTGRYFYLLFKPTPNKHFVVHLDVATTDNLIIRISFSNLFKSFKSTSTWLQLPFVCSPSPGHTPAYVAEATRDQSGPAPMVTRWTVLCLDLQHMLSMYLNRRFHYIKSMRLCSSMTVKNIFTSDTLYDPDLTLADAKREGLMTHGICPLPRDMSYPVGKGESWHDLYDWIRFPSDSSQKPFDSIQKCSSREKSGKTALASKSDEASLAPPRRIQPRTVDVSKCVSDRVSMIHKITAPKQGPKHDNVTKEVPELATNKSSNHRDEVHVFAHPNDRKAGTTRAKSAPSSGKSKPVKEMFTQDAPRPYKSLEPDPVMKLKKIVGFGGATYQDALWSSDGSSIVYPCHAVVVCQVIATGQQRFFIGHTDKVSCLSLTVSCTLLASGQTGPMSTVRVWKFASGECLAIGKVHVHSLSSVSFSSKGTVLCGVGKDGHGKNMVVVWNTTRVYKHREMTLVAKAHTDVDITRIVIAPFDDTRKYYPRKDSAPVSANVASSLANKCMLTSIDSLTEARDIDRSSLFATLPFDQCNAADILPPQPTHDELSDEDLALKFSKGIIFAPPEGVAYVSAVTEDPSSEGGALPSPSTLDIKSKVRINPMLDSCKLSEVNDILDEFSDVLTTLPGHTPSIMHHIELTTDVPIRVRPYPVPFSSQEFVREETAKLLDLVVIEPSTSSYCSPIVLVKKKDGSL